MYMKKDRNSSKSLRVSAGSHRGRIFVEMGGYTEDSDVSDGIQVGPTGLRLTNFFKPATLLFFCSGAVDSGEKEDGT